MPRGRFRPSRPRPVTRTLPPASAFRHTQHGGGGPPRRLSRSQEACSTAVMAAPGRAAGSRALETCGLERILEALKLLLSPGGERTDFGAGLHRGSQGRQSSRAALPPATCAPQASPRPRDPEAVPPRAWELWVLSSLIPLRLK